MSDKSHNPVVLFGEIGPGQYKLSQIYDPTRDEYQLTTDTAPVSGTKYYNRVYDVASGVVSFTLVTSLSPSDNPAAMGLYVLATDAQSVAGKYVPGESSVVVVDVDNEDFPTMSLLIVQSVDDVTLKSTLVPAAIGATPETSARAVDYGNDRFMLYFDQDGVNKVLMPDRKLMLYGARDYAYRLVRGEECISRQSPSSEANELIPYVRASAQQVTLTAGNYSQYKGKLFSYLTGTNPVTISVPGDEGTRVPTFAGTFQEKELVDGVVPDKKAYWYSNSGDTKLSPVGLGGTYTIGNIINGYHVGDPTNTIITDVVQVSNYPGDSVWCYGRSGDNYVSLGRLTSAQFDAAKTTYGVTGVYRDSMLEVSTDSIYEFAPEAFGSGKIGYITDAAVAVPIYYPASCYLAQRQDISTDEVIQMEVFEFTDDGSFRMIQNVALVAKASTKIDQSQAFSRKIVGFGVRNKDGTAIVGDLEVDVGTSTEQLFNNVVPYLTYDNGDIKEVPVDRERCFAYGFESITTDTATAVGKEFIVLFKYFADGGKFETCTKKVRVCDASAPTIRKISIIPVWDNKRGRYWIYYGVYRTTAPVVEIVGPDGVMSDGKKIVLVSASILDGGVVKPIYDLGAKTELDHVVQAKLAVQISGDVLKTSIYTQDVAFKLSNWVLVSSPVKWLIGETSAYSAADLKYGTADAFGRPSFVYASGEFRLAQAFRDQDKDENFIKAFYERALDATHLPEPTHFRVRALTNRVKHYHLSDTVAIAGVVYYQDNVPVVVTPGSTKGCENYVVKVQAGETYFEEVGGVYVETSDILTVGDELSDAQRDKYYVQRTEQIATPFRSIASEYRSSPFTLEGAKEAPEMCGAIPDEDCMGLVVVEFANTTGNNPPTEDDVIYGAPVEVTLG